MRAPKQTDSATLGAEVERLKRKVEQLTLERDRALGSIPTALKDHAAEIDVTLQAFPVNLVYFNPDMSVGWINKAMASDFGYQPEQMIGKNWYQMVPALEARKAHYDRVLAGGTFDQQGVAVATRRGERFFDVSYRPVRSFDQQPLGMVVFAVDRTELIQATADLQQSEARYRLLVENVVDLVLLINEQGHIVDCNPAACQQLGYRREELLDLSVLELGEQWSAQQPQADSLQELVESKPEVPVTIEGRARCKDGSTFPIEGRLSSFKSADRLLVLGVIRDITERHQNDELRARFLEDVLTAQEEERRRIARELHDETSQSLAAIGLGLEGIVETAESAQVVRQAERLQTTLARTTLEVGRLARGLHPYLFEELGFAAAIGQLAREQAQMHGLEIDLEIPDAGQPLDLSRGTGSALYRVVQEALTNVVKHAKASTVSIILHRTAERLRMVIEDDGLGMPPPTPPDLTISGGLGLQGVRERVALLKGTVLIDSMPDRGTSLVIEIPVNP